jgi:hypothetical protein
MMLCVPPVGTVQQSWWRSQVKPGTSSLELVTIPNFPLPIGTVWPKFSDFAAAFHISISYISHDIVMLPIGSWAIRDSVGSLIVVVYFSGEILMEVFRRNEFQGNTSSLSCSNVPKLKYQV